MIRRHPVTIPPKARRLLLAVLSAGLSAFLGASHSLGAWISGVPGLLAIRQASIPLSLLCGMIAGGLSTAVTAWGLAHYAWFLYLAAIALIGGFVAAVAGLVTWLGRGRESQWTWVFIPPLVWVPLASIRSLADLPLSSNVAASQADFPAILQIAALTGPSGISFLLVVGNALLAQVISYALEHRRGTRTEPHPSALGLGIPAEESRGAARDRQVRGPLHHAPVGATSRSRDREERSCPTPPWRGGPLVFGMAPSRWYGLGLVAVTFIGGSCLWGAVRLWREPPQATGTKVALVQGGLPIAYYHQGASDQAMRKLLRDRYVQLTQFAATSNPAMIVWPEEPTLGDLLSGEHLDPAVATLAKKSRAALLIGSSTSALGALSPELRFNSALLIASTGELLGRYDKRRPTPFEPYRPGHRPPLLTGPVGLMGLLICEESLYPSLPRDLVRQGAELLVELSNDAGFGHAWLARFHAQEAVLTAVTYHRPYVRAGQSGPSYLIDAFGRIQARSAPFDSTVLIGMVSPSQAPPLVLRWGEWLPVLCLILCVRFALVSHRASPARPSSMRDR